MISCSQESFFTHSACIPVHKETDFSDESDEDKEDKGDD